MLSCAVHFIYCTHEKHCRAACLCVLYVFGTWKRVVLLKGLTTLGFSNGFSCQVPITKISAFYTVFLSHQGWNTVPIKSINPPWKWSCFIVLRHWIKVDLMWLLLYRSTGKDPLMSKWKQIVKVIRFYMEVPSFSESVLWQNLHQCPDVQSIFYTLTWRGWILIQTCIFYFIFVINSLCRDLFSLWRVFFCWSESEKPHWIYFDWML